MVIASFWRLCHGSNGKTARRFLLPYSVINFILSVIYVTCNIVANGLQQIDLQSLVTQGFLHAALTLAFTLLILLNDALSVRDLFCVLVSHTDDS
jgi:uncharacterized membrane protein YhaH (DUF805 family)